MALYRSLQGSGWAKVNGTPPPNMPTLDMTGWRLATPWERFWWALFETRYSFMDAFLLVVMFSIAVLLGLDNLAAVFFIGFGTPLVAFLVRRLTAP